MFDCLYLKTVFERSVQQANNQVNNQSNGQLNGQMNNLQDTQQNNSVTTNPAATILSSNPNSGSVATAGVNNLINTTTESSFHCLSSKHVIFKTL